VPCFHTHWLVALQAIESNPEYIGDGRQKYVAACDDYKQALMKAIDAREFKPEQTRSEFRQALKDEAAKWKNGIQTSKEYDAITCFSAYMLGACGPDFWTVGSTARFLRTFIPDTAPEHFDLGHYNRTHHQFELSVADVGGANKTDLQSLVQRAYFLGMATHIAADLVVHQLVNISAGAYNLLEKWNYIFPDKAWQNEDWTFGSLGYRYLGDQGPFWPEQYKDQENWFGPLGFPTSDSLLDYAKRTYKDNIAVVDDCEHVLKETSIKYLIERPLMFPWVFCDRVLADSSDIKPFIYRIVVEKDGGAYPEDVAPKKVVKEKDSHQMGDSKAAGGHSERKKLHFFSSAENDEDGHTSFNFLTFFVCPNVTHPR
jgi:Zinc dependent phospholipase C